MADFAKFSLLTVDEDEMEDMVGALGALSIAQSEFMLFGDENISTLVSWLEQNGDSRERTASEIVQEAWPRWSEDKPNVIALGRRLNNLNDPLHSRIDVRRKEKHRKNHYRLSLKQQPE